MQTDNILKSHFQICDIKIGTLFMQRFSIVFNTRMDEKLTYRSGPRQCCLNWNEKWNGESVFCTRFQLKISFE